MILAIETSCDDSAVALINLQGEVLYSEISSQIKLHERFGGIVPEIASRKHLTTLPLILRELFRTQSLRPADLSAVAVTYAPGLIGSLLVGVSFAKSLAWLFNKPLIGVDHLEGHLLAPFLDHPDLSFPYLALIASGGHTHLYIANGIGQYELIGKTIDDAAGEAYDKVAKMLGFKYPGGPSIDKIAEEYKGGDIEFPIPLNGKKTLNFSFSGLKTALRNEIIKQGCYWEGSELFGYDSFLQDDFPGNRDRIINLASSFQRTMEVIITKRMEQAINQTGLKRFVLSGGVASNIGIRRSLTKMAKKKKAMFYFPEKIHCTDNAAMIGYTAFRHLSVNQELLLKNIPFKVNSKSPMGQLEISSATMKT
ncbi:MAG: tRNA (adenosine(37)-N6)-threonylcarbamoyltransferase complex transferase subunit TsaD [Deltaproteobacteria bacterium]|nr:tRNA (adenosine(37)-N6)-threonylcarbamoyltransferase complex transferase subunit TsaD [Deltaproteobacteria bacterium]